MGTAGDSASERGRFAAREFLARWSRETGEVTSAVVTDRMLFAYEVGYMCGGRELMAMHASGGLAFEEADDAWRARERTRPGGGSRVRDVLGRRDR